MPRALIAIGALLLAGMAACINPFATGRGPEVALDFDIQRAQTEPPFVVTTDAGEVRVRGNFSTPCIPYGAVADVERTAGTLTVRLEGRQPGACRDAIGTYGYQATVRRVPAGSYQLRVVHTRPETAWPMETVVDMQITVP